MILLVLAKILFVQLTKMLSERLFTPILRRRARPRDLRDLLYRPLYRTLFSIVFLILVAFVSFLFRFFVCAINRRLSYRRLVKITRIFGRSRSSPLRTAVIEYRIRSDII